MNCIIHNILWTDGAGCSNLAMSVEGEEADFEMLANGLTMALMPSKWSTTGDTIPEGDNCTVFVGQHSDAAAE
jgi:hypothetical protein